MVVGVLSLELAIPGNRSLKGKRGALRPLLAALQREFGVSVAEVGAQDAWQRALVGVCVVSGDRRHADQVLAAALNRAAGWTGDTVLGASSMELIDVDPG
jgi:uncharacterized protein YlxP (DUF503 family)